MRKTIIIFFLLFLSFFLIFPSEGGNKIILLYKSSDGQSADNNNAVWYLIPILTNWGFELEYFDVDIKLPDPGSLDNVYAVISWLSSGSTEKPLELINWYENIINNNIRLVLMGNLGFWSNKKTKQYLSEEEINKVLLKLGVEYKGEWTNQKNILNVIYTDKEMYANDYEVTDETNYFLFKPSTQDICRHLIIGRNDLNDSESILVFSSPKGGMAFYSFMFQGKTTLLNFNNFLTSSLFTNNRGQNILIAGNNIQNITNIKEIFKDTELITKETNMDNFLAFCPERLKMYNLIIIEGTDYQEFSEDFVNKLNDYTSSGRGIIIIGDKKNLPGLKGKVVVWSNDKFLSNKSNPLFLQVAQSLLKKETMWGLKDKKTIEQFLAMIENKAFTNIEELEEENFDLTNIIASLNIYLNLLDEYKYDYSSTVKDIDNSLAYVTKNEKNMGTENLEAELNDINNKIISMDKKQNVLDYIFNVFDSKKESLNNIFNEKKELIDIYLQAKEELNWSWNPAKFYKSFMKSYSNDQNYTSLKTLGVFLYFSQDQNYTDYYNKMYNDYSNYIKTKYEYFLITAMDNDLKDNAKYLDNNISQIKIFNPDIYYIQDELESINGQLSFSESPQTNTINQLQQKWNETKERTSSILSQIDSKKQNIYKAIYDTESYLNLELQRKMLEFEKEIVSLRIELGEYYIKTHNYSMAEAEFKKALEVDKYNLDVKLKLAEAYQLNKNWFMAMKLYKEIYETNPENTDSASNYNELANEHPKYFSSNTEFWSSGDVNKDETNNTKTYNQKTIYIKEELKLHIFLSQFIFIDFLLDIQNRTHKLDFAKHISYAYDEDDPSDLTEVASVFPNTLRYNEITFKTRLGVEIPNTGLLLYSTVGVDSFSAFQVQTDDIDNNPDRSLRDKIFSGQDDFIDQVVFYPYFDAGIVWDYIPYFNFDLTYTHQLRKDCVIPWIDGFYFSKDAYLGADPAFRTFITENDFTLNINYNFGFIKVYPLTNIYFSNTFQFIFYALSDLSQALRANAFPFTYSLTQGIDYKVFELTNIGLTHYLLFRLNYEGSQKDFEEATNISEINDKFDIQDQDIFAKLYSPHQNLKVLGGLRFIYNFQTLTEAPLAASVTCYAGAVWKDVFNKPEIIDEDDEHVDRNYNMPFIIVIVNHGIDFWLKRFYLCFQFEYSLAYDLSLDDETWQSFYGSLFIKVPFHDNLTYSKY